MSIQETTRSRRRPTSSEILVEDVGRDSNPNVRTRTSRRRRASTKSQQQEFRAASGTTIYDYVEIPFLHWRLIATCLVASTLLGGLALMLWPRSYESEAKLMIKVGRESVALDPTATTSPTLMLQKTQEEEVNSALEVLSSRRVAELVVDDLGAEAVLSGELPSAGSDAPPAENRWIATVKDFAGQAGEAVDRGMLSLGMKDPVSSRERAVRKISNSVLIFAPKRSTVVTIHAESKTPEMAQAIAVAVTESFKNEHLSVSRTEGSLEFFETQSQRVEEQLNDLMQRRIAFMQESKVVSAEEERKKLTEQLGALERDVMVARGELQQALAEVDDLSGKAEATPIDIVAGTAEQTDITWSAMRQRVYELEIQEKQLASLYAADSPKLTSVQEQLDGARKILEALDKESTSRNMTPNPVRIRLEEDLQKLQTKTVGLQSMLTEKEKQRQEINVQIDALLDFDLQLSEMNRNVALLESSLNLLKLKLEEARVIEALQSDRISNVSVFQPPTLVERPSSPNKPLLAVAFPLMGLLLGFGVALVREVGSPVLRTVSHVEHQLVRPVISTIPYSGRLRRWTRTAGGKQKANPLQATCKTMLSETLLSGGVEHLTRGKTIGVFGVDDGCGSSTLAMALAMASSEEGGLHTLLVDADLKAATVSRAFGLKGTPGLAEVLRGEVEPVDCLHRAKVNRLEVLSVSAESWSRPLEVDDGVCRSVLAEFQQDYDLIIVDLPPASRPDQAIGIAQHLDYILVVVESEKTDASQAKRLMSRLANGDAEVVGVILNKTRNHVPRVLSWFLR